MSDSERSGSSSPCGSYSSEGPYTCSLTKIYEPLSSSDDPDDETKDVIANFPDIPIKESERTNVLDILKRKSREPEVIIIPSDAYSYIKMKKPLIGDRIRDMLSEKNGWIYVNPSVVGGFRSTASAAKPKNALCDVCLFFLGGHFTVITFTSKIALYNNIQKYNVSLVNNIVARVLEKTGLTVSAVHGVIQEDTCQSKDMFTNRLDELESEARILARPATMNLDSKRFEAVTHVFLELFASNGPIVPTSPKLNTGKPGLHREKSENEHVALVKQKFEHSDRAEPEETLVDIVEFRKMRRKLSELQSDMKVLKWRLCGDPQSSTDTGLDSESYEDSFVSQGEATHVHHRRFSRRKRRCRSLSPSSTITTGYTETTTSNTEKDTGIGEETEYEERPFQDTNPTDTVRSSSEKKRDTSSTQKDDHSKNKRVFPIEIKDKVDFEPFVQAFLHEACRDGNVQIVKHIMTRGKRYINSRGKLGLTPILLAAMNGHRDVFDLLLFEGADLTVADNDKDTFLHVACLKDNVEFVKYLLTLDITDINIRGHIGRSPVMHAANMGCRRMVDLLVNQGADLAMVDDNNDTILNIACYDNDVEFVSYLLTLNIADVNVRGYCRRTPVMAAASYGCKGVFDLLVKRGADLSVVDDENSNNILHLACCGGNVKIVKYLLSLGTLDISSKTTDGQTPAQIAAINDKKEVFNVLEERASTEIFYF